MHPILLELGPITLYSFGVALAVAFLGAAWCGQWTMLRARRLGATQVLESHQVADIALWILLAGVVGARALYVLAHLDHYGSHPADSLAIWNGGLIFYGGAIMSTLVAVWYVRRRGLAIGRIADLMTPMLPLGQSIGRVGCFLNGCCYGKQTDSWLGVMFPWSNVPRYPTQLFESMVTLIFAIVFSWWIFRGRVWAQPQGGRVFLTYGICYAVWRFGVEFLRADNPVITLGLNLPQWMSILVVGLCGAWLFQLQRMGRDGSHVARS